MLQHIYTGHWVEQTTVRGFGTRKWPDWDPVASKGQGEGSTGLIYKATAAITGSVFSDALERMATSPPCGFQMSRGSARCGGSSIYPIFTPAHPPPLLKKEPVPRSTLASTPKKGEKRANGDLNLPLPISNI